MRGRWFSSATTGAIPSAPARIGWSTIFQQSGAIYPRQFPAEVRFDDGCVRGRNDFGRIGYGPPCPDCDEERYYFHLFAFGSVFLPALLTHVDLLKTVDCNAIEDAVLSCTYKRAASDVKRW